MILNVNRKEHIYEIFSPVRPAYRQTASSLQSERGAGGHT